MNSDNQKSGYRDYFDNNKYNENAYYQNKNEKNLSKDNNLYANKIKKEKKRSLIILGLFSFLIITLSVLNIRYLIRGPFLLKDPETGEVYKPNQSLGQSRCTGPACSGEFGESDLVRENLNLRLIDTDGDGISDWDELFVHGTSPYLEDTSGDGINDYDAIFVYKVNPICPAGQDCGGDSLDSSGVDKELDIYQSNDIDDINSVLESVDEEELMKNVANQLLSLSPLEIRAQLISAGFSKEELDSINDDDLMETYETLLLEYLSTGQFAE